jgi:hypothetical protein
VEANEGGVGAVLALILCSPGAVTLRGYPQELPLVAWQSQKSAAGVTIPSKSLSVAGLTRVTLSSLVINQYACFK